MSEIQVIDLGDNKIVIDLGDNKIITLDFSDCNFNKPAEPAEPLIIKK